MQFEEALCAVEAFVEQRKAVMSALFPVTWVRLSVSASRHKAQCVSKAL